MARSTAFFDNVLREDIARAEKNLGGWSEEPNSMVQHEI
jgi:hypothetical protein